jgi:hypothetical protein
VAPPGSKQSAVEKIDTLKRYTRAFVACATRALAAGGDQQKTCDVVKLEERPLVMWIGMD